MFVTVLSWETFILPVTFGVRSGIRYVSISIRFDRDRLPSIEDHIKKKKKKNRLPSILDYNF